jgi:hypothetical protein
MPLAPMPRPTFRARVFAVLALLVAPTGAIAVALRRGVLPLDDAWIAKMADASVDMRGSIGARGPISLAVDSIYSLVTGGLTSLLFAAQTMLSLILVVAAVATLRGDEAGAWSMRRWAWLTVAVDGVNLAATGGYDAASWVRIAFAAAAVACLPRPFDPTAAGFEPLVSRPPTAV